MPIYEYLCGKCEREFEAEQRITDDPLKTCPHCKSRKVKRLISQTSFVLKGSGWYSDLYSSGKKADDSGSKADSSDTKSSDSTDSGGKTGGDSDKKSTKSKDSSSASGGKKKGGKAAA